MSKLSTSFIFLSISLIIFASCTGNGGGIPDNSALKITGNVNNPIGWSEDQVLKMDKVEVESTNKDGETKSYTGVKITDLLALAELKADVTNLIFVGDDGFTAEVSLAEIQSCPDCIVSFRSQGGFSIVMPGFPGKVQIKGVIELQGE